jgi:hypothetical protein
MNLLAISIWAKNHIVQARWLIFGLCYVGNTTGFWAGVALDTEGWQLPGAWLWSGLAVAGAGILSYPDKRKTGHWDKWRIFTRQRISHGAVFGATCLLWTYLGNQTAREYDPKPAFLVQNAPFQPVSISEPEGEPVPAGNILRKWKKNFRKEFRSQIRNFRKQHRDLPVAVKVLMVLFGVLLILAIQLFTLVLACSLSCSGMDFLALLTLLGGTGLTCLIAYGIYRIIRRHPYKPSPDNN